MSGKHVVAVLVATAVLVGAAAPGALAAASGDLAVTVEQRDAGDATVSVTSNGTAVANATVNVTASANATYDGTGTYETDANGTVGLPAPNQTVNVTVTATHENRTASATAELLAANTTDGNTTDGNETDANATVFGQRVAAYVHYVQSQSNDTAGPLGLLVSEFATANNPSTVAGPPAWAGPSNGTVPAEPPENVTEGQGPPESGANESENGNGQGPPEHAGGNGNGQGPPEHAGGNGNGQGPPENAGAGRGAEPAGGPPT